MDNSILILFLANYTHLGYTIAQPTFSLRNTKLAPTTNENQCHMAQFCAKKSNVYHELEDFLSILCYPYISISLFCQTDSGICLQELAEIAFFFPFSKSSLGRLLTNWPLIHVQMENV